MKSSTSSLVLALGALAGVCQASFKNSAPLYASLAISTGDAKYMETSSNAAAVFKTLTEELCSDKEQSLLYLRVHGLQNDELDTETFQLFDNGLKTVFDNVVYDQDLSNISFSLGRTCGDAASYDAAEYSSAEDWIVQTMNDDHQAHIVDLHKSGNEELYDTLSKVAVVYSNVIIQGVPSQKSALSMNINAQTTEKRHSGSFEDLTSEEIEKTLRDAFEEVEEVIDERSEDFDDDGEQINVKEESASSGKSKVVSGGLFDAYTFFTPGIWMATIVSLFLFYLVSIALSWLGSMQISYKAFDKPVDFEKKLQ